MFKRLAFINEQLYGVELANCEIEHKEPDFVGLFIQQFAKVRLLELFHKLVDKYWDVTKDEELKTATDWLYLTLAEQDLYDCIRLEIKEQWEALQSADCTDLFFAGATRSFFPRTFCAKPNKHDKSEPELFKKELRCTGVLCLCSKTDCCYDVGSNKCK